MSTIFHPDSPVVKWLERVADVLILNLLYLVLCVPVFTIGAATTALYRVFLNFEDKNEASPIKAFWEAFRSNFKQSTLLFLIILLPLTCVVLYLALVLNGLVIDSFVIKAMGVWATAMIMMFWSFLWPVQAQFENDIGSTLKNAAILAFSNLLRAIVMAAINFFPLFLFLSIPESINTIAVIWTFFGFSVSAMLNTKTFKKVISRILKEQAEENQKAAE